MALAQPSGTVYDPECLNPTASHNVPPNLLFLLVNSEAQYGGDVFSAAFKHDFEVARTALRGYYTGNSVGRLSAAQPKVAFESYYYNPIASNSEKAAGLCATVSKLLTRAEGESNYRVMMVSTLTGANVVAHAIETCLPTLPVPTETRYTYNAPSGVRQFNSRVLFWTLYPDPLFSFRPPSAAYYPFLEYDLYKDFRRESSVWQRIDNHYLSPEPLAVMTWDISPKTLYDNNQVTSYPWRIDNEGHLPSDSAAVRRDYAFSFARYSLNVCLPYRYCELPAHMNEFECYCKVFGWDSERCNPLAFGPTMGALSALLSSPALATAAAHFAQGAFGAEPGGPRPRVARCGDGRVDTGIKEECDDGNKLSGDGCDKNCLVERCGNNRLEGNEECEPIRGLPNALHPQCGIAEVMRVLRGSIGPRFTSRCTAACKCETEADPPPAPVNLRIP